MTKLISIAFLVSLDAGCVEFEPVNQAIAKALGSRKAIKKTVSRNLASKNMKHEYYVTKDKSGKMESMAFIQSGIYEPNCTHTWVVALNAKTKKIKDIRVVEMSCPHAFPTKSSSFLDQYKGKGPADLKQLRESVNIVAKATGSSHLTSDAVHRSITLATRLAN